jgi:hypothetical protein
VSDDAPQPGAGRRCDRGGRARHAYLLDRGADYGDLVARLALVLGEHMHDDDELHITYNAMQNGWVEHDPSPGA